MITISILGSGNVAQHLATAFSESPETELLQVYARNTTVSRLPYHDKMIHDIADLAPADVYIIAISDSAIAEVSARLPFTGRLVVHTSGSLPMDELNTKNRRGVFYPLQTFSKSKAVDFKLVPICLESENSSDYALLEKAAKAISGRPFAIGSSQRKALHVSAVFVNNFTNHLYKIAADICTENDIPFEILQPLIAETADKIKTLPPSDAQTGPAQRNDQNTIDAHLAFLKDNHQKNIYNILTQSIQHDGKKL